MTAVPCFLHWGSKERELSKLFGFSPDIGKGISTACCGYASSKLGIAQRSKATSNATEQKATGNGGTSQIGTNAYNRKREDR